MCCKTVKRREFLGLTTGLLAAAAATGRLQGRGAESAAERTEWAPDRWDPARPFRASGKKLRVQPILMYATPQRREQGSWKSWGGVQTDAAATEEAGRIVKELESLAGKAGFPLEVLPVRKVKTPEEAAQALGGERDVAVVYPATGSGGLLRACVPETGPALIFVRHRSGPVYYWYEALSTRYLASERLATAGGEPPLLKNVTVHDVFVDDLEDLLGGLRALHAVRNLAGTRIVAVGGAWGKYAPEAPRYAQEKFGLKIVDVGYDEIEPRIKALLASPTHVSRAEAWASIYLKTPGTELRTDRPFVVNAFLLYGLFKDLLEESGAQAFTIKDCMQTIIPMSLTTACLTLSLLNDEGIPAFCESDFVVIPAGILLHHLTRQPVFLHNSTFPHKGIVTCAHCAAPRRMDGNKYEAARIVTHYESEYGAAPKVEIPQGQEVTFIDPEYSSGRWVGFRGKVVDNPFLEICRSQQDVAIQGDWRRLLHEARDSHWLMAYGDHLEAAGRAARRLGIRWEEIGA